MGCGAAAVAAAVFAAPGVARPASPRPVAEPKRTMPRGGERPAVVTIVATGDIAMGRTPVLPPDGGAGLFAGVSRSLAGDVVLGNLEGALTDGGTSKCVSPTARHCFAFGTPPAYARWLRRAGFTVMNVANNHAYDFGAAGLADTTRALRRFGLLETGRPASFAVQRVGRTRVAIVGFAPYPWAASVLDLESARRLVRAANARADVVVVTMHAGAEGVDRTHVRPGAETYLGEPRGDVVAFAHAVVTAGADLVVGHGPHVLRGMEWYRGRLIAYSLGNFAAHETLAVSGLLGVSAILRVTLRADGSWARGRLVPARLVASGTPTVDRTRAAHRLVDRLSRADFGDRAVRVSPGGTLLPPAAARGRASRSGGRD